MDYLVKADKVQSDTFIILTPCKKKTKKFHDNKQNNNVPSIVIPLLRYEV